MVVSEAEEAGGVAASAARAAGRARERREMVEKRMMKVDMVTKRRGELSPVD